MLLQLPAYLVPVGVQLLQQLLQLGACCCLVDSPEEHIHVTVSKATGGCCQDRLIRAVEHSADVQLLVWLSIDGGTSGGRVCAGAFADKAGGAECCARVMQMVLLGVCCQWYIERFLLHMLTHVAARCCLALAASSLPTLHTPMRPVCMVSRMWARSQHSFASQEAYTTRN